MCFKIFLNRTFYDYLYINNVVERTCDGQPRESTICPMYKSVDYTNRVKCMSTTSIFHDIYNVHYLNVFFTESSPLKRRFHYIITLKFNDYNVV